MRFLALCLLCACTSGDKAPQSTPIDPPEGWGNDPSGEGGSGEEGGGEEGGEGGGGDTGEEEIIADAARQDLFTDNSTAIQVAVWKDGALIYSAAFGNKEPGGEAATTQTLFQIGSDTKKITAIAALQQVEAGRMALDDPMDLLLPASVEMAISPEWDDKATLHHLLSHQGGLYDYTPWDHDPDDSALLDRAAGAFSERSWAMAPGGLFWNYANPNFSLVGLATEQADGRAWADIVEQDIFAPLGMSRSYARLEAVVADGDWAHGNGFKMLDSYDPLDPFGVAGADYETGVYAAEEQPDNAFTRPAGLVWSTAEDQVKLAAFLLEGDPEVLSDDLRSAISTAQVPMYPQSPDLQGYGYGLMLLPAFSFGSDWIETELWLHGGNTLTMTSATYVLPSRRVAISILSNGYGDSNQNLTRALLETYGDLPGGEAIPAFFDEETDPGRMAGHYFDHLVGNIELSWDGEALTVSMPDLEAAGVEVEPEVEVVAEAYLALTLDGQQQALMFVDGADGRRYLVNRLFVGQEVEEPTALRRPARLPLSLDPRPMPLPSIGGM